MIWYDNFAFLVVLVGVFLISFFLGYLFVGNRKIESVAYELFAFIIVLGFLSYKKKWNIKKTPLNKYEWNCVFKENCLIWLQNVYYLSYSLEGFNFFLFAKVRKSILFCYIHTYVYVQMYVCQCNRN